LTFYVQQSGAAGARLKETAASDPFDLDRFDLPAADAMVYLAAHVGEGFYLLHAIDASVTDERDPVSCDPTLDLYDLANGFVEPPGETRYEPEFVKRYRNGQRARVERLDTLARERGARRRDARARWGQTSPAVGRPRTGPGMTLPARVVSYSGHHGIFPSDTDIIATSLAAPRVDRVEIDADHYGFPTGREQAVGAIADWIDATK